MACEMGFSPTVLVNRATRCYGSTTSVAADFACDDCSSMDVHAIQDLNQVRVPRLLIAPSDVMVQLHLPRSAALKSCNAVALSTALMEAL